ncbi:uncharacterized protein LOC115794225 [Archocentrus centrarchus]|uniref:uncharacterized protein LOC115794225 n=1 Tax=Archocentrus centrarchus TaxID=63155 RepID=UPI0011EA14B9|nr:uncharacterized protein LOC115794225 [Archocentrus centrarchus]
MERLKEMKRTDLAQRLSDCSSLPRKKHSVDDRRSALIHTVATMAAVKHLLLGTLNDLSNEEFKKFQRFLQMIFPQKNLSYSLLRLESSDRAEFVDLMVDELGQRSVEVTRKVFLYMKRTDLIQKLSEGSSGSREKLSVDEDEAALLKREEELEAVRQILFETLKDLRFEDLNKFRLFLKFTCFKMGLPQIQTHRNTAEELVNQMVDELGHQSVEVIMEVLTDLKRTDLVQRLSESSSGLKEKHSVDEHLSVQMQTALTIQSDREKLLGMLDDFRQNELENFKGFLGSSDAMMGLCIPKGRLEEVPTYNLVDLMLQTYTEKSVEVTKNIFKKINRNDLVQRLSESSSGLKGRETGGSSESEDCGSVMQDSSDWTKLEPEVNGTDADEAPTYSLQSEEGHFECSVSGLRWVCKEKASFQYQFGSWEGHMERMESRGYMPAGPLMDVTVTAGKLNEVHLPHWICTDDIPDILDKFAVLHIDDCGDVVEKVSEVTPSHVKIMEPNFSLIGALISFFFPPKINCFMLMYYKPNTSFLKLHLYPMRQDPALEQRINKDETSDGYKRLKKPHPDRYLQTEHAFSLRADMETAEIQPEELTFRYNSLNFYEVYIKDPEEELNLTLVDSNDGEPEHEPVWKCKIHTNDYSASGRVEEKHSEDERWPALIHQSTSPGSSKGNPGAGTGRNGESSGANPGSSGVSPDTRPGSIGVSPGARPGSGGVSPGARPGSSDDKPEAGPAQTGENPEAGPGSSGASPETGPGSSGASPETGPRSSGASPETGPGSSGKRPGTGPGSSKGRPGTGPGSSGRNPATGPGSSGGRPETGPGSSRGNGRGTGTDQGSFDGSPNSNVGNPNSSGRGPAGCGPGFTSMSPAKRSIIKT